jgi:hypothetical protein
MTRLYFLAFPFIGCGACLAQERSAPNREAFELKLFVNDSNFYESDVAAGPYFVHEGVVQIYPGEDLFIAAKLRKGELQDMHVVTDPKDTSEVIHVKFYQIADGRKHTSMMLEVHNPFEGELHYAAAMYLMEHKQWAPTSIIPVMPKLTGFETWSDVIVTMALSEWKVTSPK